MAGLFNFNNRIGTTQNLPQGGTYDLLMISFPEGFPQSKLVFEIADTPRKVTGIQKVAQMFLKLLFTQRGSNVVYPNQGTYFSNYVVNANRTTDDPTLTAELIQELNSAQNQCQFIMNTSGSDPASQLKKAELLGLDVAQDQLVIYLRILTNAGAMASVAIPFPQLDLPLSDEMIK